MDSTPTTGPPDPQADLAFQRQLRDMNEALLVSALKQHELAEQSEKANALVRESEERYRTLFGLVPVAVYSCDTSGVIQTFNRRAAELWGREPALGVTDERFCGSFKLFRPDGSLMPHEQCPISEVLSGKISLARDEEVLIERPDGSRITVVVNIHPLKNQRGEVTGAINCFYDITERKRAEALLSCQKQAFEMVAVGAPLMEVLEFLVRTTESQSPRQALVAIHLLDESGARFEQTVAPSLPPGYSQAVNGMAVSSATGSCCAAVAGRRRVVISNIAASKEWPAFASFALPLGLRAAASTPIFSSSDKVVGTFVTYYREVHEPEPQEAWLAQIVTRTAAVVIERKEAEAKLRESEQRLRFIMDSAPQKIFTAKPNGDIDYFNPIWMEFTGLSFEQIKDWGWKQFIHPDDVEENVRRWQHSIDTGEPIQFEHRFRRADGEYRWHLSRGQAMRDAAGKVVMWVGSNTDIHEQKQTANQLQQLAASLSEADLRKNEFLAMLAHELRNPLAPILNAVHLLRLGNNESPLQQQARTMIERQVGQLTRLVDDLLEVSRITTGRVHLRQERIVVSGIVARAAETVHPLMDRHRHELTVTVPPQPIWLYADAARLEQVVVNLLTNAAKYTDDGGRVWLSVEQEGVEAVLRVRDTGVGISPQLLPRVFELFTQAERSLDRAQGGLGIGLALVQRLVEMHGGRVEAYSVLGRGSEFVVRLPVVPMLALQPPSAPKETAGPNGSPLRVLVVDDNVDSAESLAMLLEMSRHEVRTAHDGPTALEAALDFRPNVVLLDIGLPIMDGYEVAKRMRQQPTLGKVLLVAMTGYGQESDRQLSREAGFDHHLVKPADFSALEKLLASAKTTTA
jgi:PAS domain S-box-containing protein